MSAARFRAALPPPRRFRELDRDASAAVLGLMRNETLPADSPFSQGVALAVIGQLEAITTGTGWRYGSEPPSPLEAQESGFFGLPSASARRAAA
jgi:hypothetical protein